MKRFVQKERGFTLVELLVVIAILAVLATAVVVVLNPAELLKQARDSTRISDLSAMNHTISLWVADVGSSTAWGAARARCTYTVTSTAPGTGVCSATSTTNAVDGTGWLNLDFRLLSIGSPLSRIPIDPANGGVPTSPVSVPNVLGYVFKASTTVGVYEIDANMESIKYSTGGSGDVESNTDDGGDASTWYEVGSSLAL